MEKQYSQQDAAGQIAEIPDLDGLTAAEAEKLLKSLNLTWKFVGTGERITGQIPAAGQRIAGGSQILVYLGENPGEELVTVPDFAGMTRQQASDLAGSLGLYILPSGNPSIQHSVIVTGQQIPPGTQVSAGTVIPLEFTDTQIRDG